jgi:hypothetical protein
MTKARDLANASTALSAVSATELAFVDGVTSAIQTQMDAKAPSSTAVTLTGTQTLTNKTLTSPALTTPTISTATTNGDILYGTGSGALARLGIGTTDQVLKVTAGVPAWATPATTGFVGCQAIGDNFTVSYTQYADLAIPFASTDKFDTNGFHDPSTNNTRITIPTGYGGKYLFTFTGFMGTQADYAFATPYINGSQYKDYFVFHGFTSFTGTQNGRFSGSVLMNLSAGDYVQVYYQSNKATGNINGYATFGCVFLGA